MIVRITRILLVLQLLFVIAIAAAVTALFSIDSPAIAALLGVGAVVLLRLQITANNFFLSSRYRSETPAAYRLNRRQACRLFFGEFRATMTSSSLHMPFRAFARHVAEKPAALPVLLIHGYGCNSGYWHAMSKALMQARITHYAIDMEPVMCGIDDYVPAIHRAVEAICRESGSEKIVIVAHSMGGLATRAYLRDHGAGRIARAITLGAPHHGTGVARFGLGLNCRQMHWTPDAGKGMPSEWLRRLAAREDEHVYKLLVSIYSHHDNIVAPQTSSRLPGAANIEYFGIGHVALAFHPAIQARVIAEIRNASRQAPAASSAVAQ
jgi:pimeloyl-ACP methyl ester carboxylesterase